MKFLILACLLSSCSYREYKGCGSNTRHIIIEEQIMVRGRVIYTIFHCENNCTFRDTFPNPKVHPELRDY